MNKKIKGLIVVMAAVSLPLLAGCGKSGDSGSGGGGGATTGSIDLTLPSGCDDTGKILIAGDGFSYEYSGRGGNLQNIPDIEEGIQLTISQASAGDCGMLSFNPSKFTIPNDTPFSIWAKKESNSKKTAQLKLEATSADTLHNHEEVQATLTPVASLGDHSPLTAVMPKPVLLKENAAAKTVTLTDSSSRAYHLLVSPSVDSNNHLAVYPKTVQGNDKATIQVHFVPTTNKLVTTVDPSYTANVVPDLLSKGYNVIEFSQPVKKDAAGQPGGQGVALVQAQQVISNMISSDRPVLTLLRRDITSGIKVNDLLSADKNVDGMVLNLTSINHQTVKQVGELVTQLRKGSPNKVIVVRLPSEPSTLSSSDWSALNQLLFPADFSAKSSANSLADQRSWFQVPMPGQVTKLTAVYQQLIQAGVKPQHMVVEVVSNDGVDQTQILQQYQALSPNILGLVIAPKNITDDANLKQDVFVTAAS